MLLVSACHKSFIVKCQTANAEMTTVNVEDYVTQHPISRLFFRATFAHFLGLQKKS